MVTESGKMTLLAFLQVASLNLSVKNLQISDLNLSVTKLLLFYCFIILLLFHVFLTDIMSVMHCM